MSTRSREAHRALHNRIGRYLKDVMRAEGMPCLAVARDEWLRMLGLRRSITQVRRQELREDLVFEFKGWEDFEYGDDSLFDIFVSPEELPLSLTREKLSTEARAVRWTAEGVKTVPLRQLLNRCPAPTAIELEARYPN